MFFTDVFFFFTQVNYKRMLMKIKKKIIYTVNCLCHVLIPLICLHYTLLQKKKKNAN